MTGAAWQAVVSAPLRAAPGRTLLALLAIATGVTLGASIHLINAGAVSAFDQATRQLAGSADLVVRGGRSGFDEALYPQLARLPQVAAASPALEIEAALPGGGSLKLVGLDALQAWTVQPRISGEAEGSREALFDPQAIRLSAAAARALGKQTGDRLELAGAAGTVSLRVAGVIPDGDYRQRLGVIDIAAAQQHFAAHGRITRIDLRLHEGVPLSAFSAELGRLLPAGVHATTPALESERGLALTRAYRGNLDMLALVALFTGAFLVFSAQALALLRRRRELALLRALGLRRGDILRALAAESLLTGLIGGVLGVVAAHLIAGQALRLGGADLGSDFFGALEVDPVATLSTSAAFVALGVAATLAGSAWPAWSAAQRPPARELHAGDEGTASGWSMAMPLGLVLLMLAGALLLRENAGLDAAYAAIALILLAALLMLPALLARMLAPLPVPASIGAALALAQLRGAPRQTAISLAAVLASFSLVVAMLVMIVSFRQSLDVWLHRVLPADLYLRSSAAPDGAILDLAAQNRIAAVPGVAEARFTRYRSVLIDPRQPALTVIARDFEAAEAGRLLPLVSAAPAVAGPPPLWASEIAAALFGWRVGDTIRLPLAVTEGGGMHEFRLAGIWRDYSRQHGAVVIERARYRELAGDSTAQDAAVLLAPAADAARVTAGLRIALQGLPGAEIAGAGDIRARSLRIFDRTFAVTWLLQAVALAVGLCGVGLAFGIQAAARRREFGMLRHLGMTRGDIARMIAAQGAFTAAAGAICGLLTGSLIGWVLIGWINRLSFHWSMDLHWPLLPLSALALLLTLLAAGAALIGARRALQADTVSAVREDW
ncbi:MAG: FtsX-like permease family protein [Betaproteobacteria bacterium]|nr:FtsX-like permease family protein [Betaproteobacteria bacterium]